MISASVIIFEMRKLVEWIHHIQYEKINWNVCFDVNRAKHKPLFSWSVRIYLLIYIFTSWDAPHTYVERINQPRIFWRIYNSEREETSLCFLCRRKLLLFISLRWYRYTWRVHRVCEWAKTWTFQSKHCAARVKMEKGNRMENHFNAINVKMFLCCHFGVWFSSLHFLVFDTA